jgi:hypothetical protein
MERDLTPVVLALNTGSVFGEADDTNEVKPLFFHLIGQANWGLGGDSSSRDPGGTTQMYPLVFSDRLWGFLDDLLVPMEENSIIFWNLIDFLLSFILEIKVLILLIFYLLSQIHLELAFLHQDRVERAGLILEFRKRITVSFGAVPVFSLFFLGF